MKKMGMFGAIVVAGLVALIGSAASAGDNNPPTRASARLIGFEEVPSVSTTGRGTFRARIDRSARRIHYTLRYSDLEGTKTTAAHIHLGQPGVAGGVIAFLCGDTKPPCPSRSGTVTGEIAPGDVIGPAGQGIAPGEFEEVTRAMRAGFTYANVHTDKHSGGEIRGQIGD
jgi:CHRD domain